eukprot:1155256-Prymnesium_polylepis.1
MALLLAAVARQSVDLERALAELHLECPLVFHGVLGVVRVPPLLEFFPKGVDVALKRAVLVHRPRLRCVDHALHEEVPPEARLEFYTLWCVGQSSRLLDSRAPHLVQQAVELARHQPRRPERVGVVVGVELQQPDAAQPPHSVAVVRRQRLVHIVEVRVHIGGANLLHAVLGGVSVHRRSRDRRREALAALLHADALDGQAVDHLLVLIPVRAARDRRVARDPPLRPLEQRGVQTRASHVELRGRGAGHHEVHVFGHAVGRSREDAGVVLLDENLLHRLQLLGRALTAPELAELEEPVERLPPQLREGHRHATDAAPQGRVLVGADVGVAARGTH